MLRIRNINVNFLKLLVMKRKSSIPLSMKKKIWKLNIEKKSKRI